MLYSVPVFDWVLGFLGALPVGTNFFAFFVDDVLLDFPDRTVRCTSLLRSCGSRMPEFRETPREYYTKTLLLHKSIPM